MLQYARLLIFLMRKLQAENKTPENLHPHILKDEIIKPKIQWRADWTYGEKGKNGVVLLVNKKNKKAK